MRNSWPSRTCAKRATKHGGCDVDQPIVSNHHSRPLDMLQRQMAANRSAVRYQNKETGLRHFCHEPIFRTAFFNDIILLRRALRKAGAA
jgi:hypothetical protein